MLGRCSSWLKCSENRRCFSVFICVSGTFSVYLSLKTSTLPSVRLQGNGVVLPMCLKGLHTTQSSESIARGNGHAWKHLRVYNECC